MTALSADLAAENERLRRELAAWRAWADNVLAMARIGPAVPSDAITAGVPTQRRGDGG